MVPVSRKQDGMIANLLELLHQPIKLSFSSLVILAQRSDANTHDDKISALDLKLNKSIFRNQLVFVVIRIGTVKLQFRLSNQALLNCNQNIITASII